MVFRETLSVWKDVSLSIPLGCFTVILWPNGPGKSTSIELLSREFYPAVNAKTLIRIFGQETWTVRNHRRRLGLVSADCQHDYWGMNPWLEGVHSGFFSSVDLFDHQAINHFQRAQSYAMMEQLGGGVAFRSTLFADVH